MKILYDSLMAGESSRKVFVDEEHFTDLFYEDEGASFVDTQHPYVNLARLFEWIFVGKSPLLQ